MALLAAPENGNEQSEMEWEGDKSSGRKASKRDMRQEVFEEILRRLVDEGHEETTRPGFADELQAHFLRLPTRYALDVKKDKACNVLIHKRLLEQAEVPENLPVFHVRPLYLEKPESGSSLDGSPSDSPLNRSGDTSPLNTNTYSLSTLELGASDLPSPPKSTKQAFTDMPSPSDSKDPSNSSMYSIRTINGLFMHEVIFSAIDRPKLLSQLSTILADVKLHIWEAHIFSTDDGYSLDVFVVYGWRSEHTEGLERALRSSIALIDEGAWRRTSASTSPSSSPDFAASPIPGLADGPNDWEIDHTQLKFVKKLQSAADSYQGAFCGQDVMIKLFNPETNLQDFTQEILIMRKVRHKNIVQFIGACTRPPHLCIITEYMPRGTVHDFLRKKSALRLHDVVRMALDVAKAMDYLHQNKIIHRDLKASSLFMDENKVVKVGDFGVARFQALSGMMTAETGTYRWMAPEVIGHNLYDQKADVFSFGIVVWELLTKKLPYDCLSPFQAAIGVVRGELRPPIPQDTHPKLAQLLEGCWQANPSTRPEFSAITAELNDLTTEMEGISPGGSYNIGFFSSLSGRAPR